MQNSFENIPLTGWYPGHMLKAGRQMQARLRLVDFVVEILDARIPLTSRNPAFHELLGHKPRFLVFNKKDLIGSDEVSRWQKWFGRRGEHCLFFDAQTGADTATLTTAWHRYMDRIRQQRGIRRRTGDRPVRLMICGVPNGGKSTLINRLVKSRQAAVGAKPGVTRGQQWIRLKSNIELLDTPGVLWPRLQRKETELKLALTAAIKDELVGEELVAEYLWSRMRAHSERVNWALYDLEGCPSLPYDLLASVARRRGLLAAGGGIDTLRSAQALLKDYRDGRIGRFCLDTIPDREGSYE